MGGGWQAGKRGEIGRKKGSEPEDASGCPSCPGAGLDPPDRQILKKLVPAQAPAGLGPTEPLQ